MSTLQDGPRSVDKARETSEDRKQDEELMGESYEIDDEEKSRPPVDPYLCMARSSHLSS